MAVSQKTRNFAPMTKRREKVKVQNSQMNWQLEKKEEKPREKNELAFEVGKFFLDLAKLTFAGVFLSGIMGMDIELLTLVISGAVAIGMLAMVGFVFVKRGINKKK